MISVKKIKKWFKDFFWSGDDIWYDEDNTWRGGCDNQCNCDILSQIDVDATPIKKRKPVKKTRK